MRFGMLLLLCLLIGAVLGVAIESSVIARDAGSTPLELLEEITFPAGAPRGAAAGPAVNLLLLSEAPKAETYLPLIVK
jgi:hypothetical protein